MRSIVKCIYNHSLSQPNKTALIAPDRTVDYATLWSMVAGMAALLKEKGLGKGEWSFWRPTTRWSFW